MLGHIFLSRKLHQTRFDKKYKIKARQFLFGQVRSGQVSELKCEEGCYFDLSAGLPYNTHGMERNGTDGQQAERRELNQFRFKYIARVAAHNTHIKGNLNKTKLT